MYLNEGGIKPLVNQVSGPPVVSLPPFLDSCSIQELTYNINGEKEAAKIREGLVHSQTSGHLQEKVRSERGHSDQGLQVESRSSCLRRET